MLDFNFYKLVSSKLCLLLIFITFSCHYSMCNPCFFDPTSNFCLDYIALRRQTTRENAAHLRAQVLALYEHEESSPSAVFDVQTVAVACLASPGTLRPGPDSDCAACGPACTQESRLEVCKLYCTTQVEITTNKNVLMKSGVTIKKAEQELIMAVIKFESQASMSKHRTMVVKLIWILLADGIILFLISCIIISILFYKWICTRTCIAKWKKDKNGMNKSMAIPKYPYPCTSPYIQ